MLSDNYSCIFGKCYNLYIETIIIFNLYSFMTQFLMYSQDLEHIVTLLQVFQSCYVQYIFLYVQWRIQDGAFGANAPPPPPPPFKKLHTRSIYSNRAVG